MDVYYIDLGLTDFSDTWELQKQILNAKQKKELNDVLIFTEHNPVYTLGKNGTKDHLLINENHMSEKKISFHEIDRGGDITFHGPGQLVCYPILDLNNYYKDIHRFLRELEEVIILSLNDLGIKAKRDEPYTGVWVDNEKICAIGIKVSRWITMHGLALNVNNELNYFDNIIPCGIFHKGVTSISKILGRQADMKEITRLICKYFRETMKMDILNIEFSEIFNIYNN